MFSQSTTGCSSSNQEEGISESMKGMKVHQKESREGKMEKKNIFWNALSTQLPQQS